MTDEAGRERAAIVADHPWDENEDGLWCPACGNMIQATFNIDDDYVAPEACRQCGFPDFEDGTGYFTDD